LLERRRFLGSTAAAAALLALHDLPVWAQDAAPQPFSTEGRPRILAMELFSAAPLGVMKEFYGRQLDLAVRSDQPDRLIIDAGETRMTFVESANTGSQRPFYHFAFNIPENKILQALEWQKARTALLPVPESHRAPGFPAEVAVSRHWNAHSIFFLDPAGNLVEYIARHDMKNADASSPFNWSDLLYISEIALVVDDVPATAALLRDAAALGAYRNSSDELTAMGDEFGMLIVAKRGRRLDLTPIATPDASVYRTAVAIRGPKAARHQLASYPYEIGVEERCSCA
jgi:catechol-2,3-dioxygenase